MFSFFSCGEDQTAAWSEVARHNQQAAVPCDGSAAAPIAMSTDLVRDMKGVTHISQPHDLDWIFALVANDMVITRFGLRGLEAASAGAFDPSPSYSSNVPDHYNRMNTESFATGFAPTPALTDSDTIASSPSDAPWGELDIPSTSPVAEPQCNAVPCGPSAADLPYQAESAWQFGPGIFSPSYTVSDGTALRLNAPGFNFAGNISTTSIGSQTISSASYMPAPMKTKRHDNNACGPTRRVERKMRRNRVLEAAGSTSRAHQKPADRAPTEINDISEAQGRGAGKLAAPIAHEVYHQFMPGSSVQEVLMGNTAQGRLPWIEGSEGSITLDYTGNAVGQLDGVNTAEDGEDAEKDGFRIPKGLSERNQRLLMATPEERARGVVCPKAGFSKWENFIRYCDRTEAHPKGLVFCRFCGDFFFAPRSAGPSREESP